MKKVDTALSRLGKKLLGTWKLSGEATGKIQFDWLDPGVFLKQHFDITVFGRRNEGEEARAEKLLSTSDELVA